MKTVSQVNRWIDEIRTALFTHTYSTQPTQGGELLHLFYHFLFSEKEIGNISRCIFSPYASARLNFT